MLEVKLTHRICRTAQVIAIFAALAKFVTSALRWVWNTVLQLAELARRCVGHHIEALRCALLCSRWPSLFCAALLWCS